MTTEANALASLDTAKVSASGRARFFRLLRDWCWLGTARDEGDLAHIIEAPPRPEFDIDIAKLLLRRHKAGLLPLTPISTPATAHC